MKHQSLWLLSFSLLTSGLLAPVQAQEPNPGKAPTATAVKALSANQLVRLIDQEIAEKWAKNQITPAPLATDSEFLRRVYLDLAGRIPRVSEVREFLEDKSPDKREQLIDKLLEGSQYVKHFSKTWTDLILPQQGNAQLAFFGVNFQQWVRQKVEANTPYDEMVREILNSPTTGGIRQPGTAFNPANNATQAFYQANENKPENVAAATTRLFLGVRLECAQCHDHPFSTWKRQQFWEFAAFFTSIQPQQIVNNGRIETPPKPKTGVIAIPGTDKTVSAKYLDGEVPNLADNSDPRKSLAEWMTSPQNPYFARTAVNRLWGHFFGMGLINPVDDEPTAENPPSHPELLKMLEEQFVAHKYDAKYIIRAIALSRTYQRSSVFTHPSQKEPHTFARMGTRGLTPDQLFDSIAVATGYQEANNFGDARIVAFNNPNSARGEFLTKFASTDNPMEKQTSILQALTLMNGKVVSNATSLQKSLTLTAVIQSPFFDTREKIETLYLSTLSRYPRPEELGRLSEYVNTGGPRQDPQQALGDVFWALLNSSEFILNH